MNHPEAGGSEKYLDEVARAWRPGTPRDHPVPRPTRAPYPDEIVDGVRTSGAAAATRSTCARSSRLRVGAAPAPTSSSTSRTACRSCPRWSPGSPVVNLVHHVHREQWPVVFGPLVARVGWWLESRLAPRDLPAQQLRRGVGVDPATSWPGSGVDADRITVIHNGTDAVARTDTYPRAHPVVVVLGRLVPQKRVEIAHGGRAPRWSRSCPDLQLVGRRVGLLGAPSCTRGRRRLGDRATTSPSPATCREAEKHRLLARGVGAGAARAEGGLGPGRRRGRRARHPHRRVPDAGGVNESVRDGRPACSSRAASLPTRPLSARCCGTRLCANGSAPGRPSGRRHSTGTRPCAGFEAVLAAAVGGSTARLADPRDDDAWSRDTSIGPEPSGEAQPAS